MVMEAIRQAFFVDRYSLGLNGINDTKRGLGMAKIVFIFYWSKIPEFVDTFIMVLKKSDRQISFLHLYHHATIFSIWWYTTFVAPGA